MLGSIFGIVNPTPENFLNELMKQEPDIELLGKLLQSDKFPINYLNENKDTFLNLCILKNKTKAAKWLISKGINARLKNKNNQEAINIAIKKDNHLILDYILENTNVDVNQLDDEKRSFLQNAVIQGQNRIINVLIQHGVDVNNIDKNNRNVLFDAISYGDDNLIDIILQINDLDMNLIDNNGQTILHQDGILENEQLCEKLIQHGADPTICDSNGQNLLYYSAIKGMKNISIINLAVENKFNLNTPLKNNNTILMEALRVFHKIPSCEKERRDSLLSMANSLVEKGVEVDALNKYGENALFEAVRNNNYETCSFLINNKININKQNRLKQTPLLLACYKGIDYLDIILLLLHKGADPRIKNELNQDIVEIINHLVLHIRGFKIIKNNFILNYANEHGQYLIVLKELLANSKYDLKQLDSSSQPRFFDSILFDDNELFELYRINGFDINQRNKSGLNIFYVYANLVFNINRYFDNFKSKLIRLIQEKVDIGNIDNTGKTIFSKVIKKDTNAKLYKVLLDTCRFKYDAQDSQGRTFMHYAVLNKNIDIIQMIYKKDKNVINISDIYGILPLTYAVLMGYHNIVEDILSHTNIHIKSGKEVPLIVKQKFAPMLKTIDNLKSKTEDTDMLRKITILTDQVKSDFAI